MAMQRGLGRGLDALFQGQSNANAAKEQDKTSLPLTVLVPNPEQPRKEFDPAALEELAASIRSQGVLQPILVRPAKEANQYEIIAGERRWRASRLAGLSHVPVLIKNLSDEEAMAVALVENLQRADLNPLEEALGMAQVKEQCGISQDELARRLGKSRPAVANCLRLLQLEKAVQSMLGNGALSAGHARALLAITSESDQLAAATRITEQELSVRDAENIAAYWKEHKALPAVNELPAPRAPQNGAKETAHSGTQFAPDVEATLSALCKKLQHTLGVHATVRGSAEKGKVTLSYASSQELATLLDLMGKFL